ncbi:MAG TPA: GNAT family N-acetyltransferase [Balneolales bacterium]|nr:GNAT family N-acetyltransferase [Balneolales bacterium]
MITYNIFDGSSFETANVTRDDIADFLYVHLDEFGDDKKDILKCLDYALSEEPGRGGFIVLAQNDDTQIVGAVIINVTGMSGYIPENILVYIAVNRDYRGKGIGKKLMEHTIEHADGDIALHVEPHNPAKFLYEKYGFTNKYLEMRYKQ